MIAVELICITLMTLAFSAEKSGGRAKREREREYFWAASSMYFMLCLFRNLLVMFFSCFFLSTNWPVTWQLDNAAEQVEVCPSLLLLMTVDKRRKSRLLSLFITSLLLRILWLWCGYGQFREKLSLWKGSQICGKKLIWGRTDSFVIGVDEDGHGPEILMTKKRKCLKPQ